MPRTCFYCGKGPTFGRRITRRGMAKKKGGVGRKIVGISVRKFSPNLQRVKALVDGIKYSRGKPRSILLREELDALSSPQQATGYSRAVITKTIYACTKCIHMGRVVKPVKAQG